MTLDSMTKIFTSVAIIFTLVIISSPYIPTDPPIYRQTIYVLLTVFVLSLLVSGSEITLLASQSYPNRVRASLLVLTITLCFIALSLTGFVLVFEYQLIMYGGLGINFAAIIILSLEKLKDKLRLEFIILPLVLSIIMVLVYLYPDILAYLSTFDFLSTVFAFIAALVSIIAYVFKAREISESSTEAPQTPPHISSPSFELRIIKPPNNFTTRKDHILWLLYKNRDEYILTSALAEALDVPRGSVHSILSNCERRDLVDRPTSRMGWKISEMGISYIREKISSEKS